MPELAPVMTTSGSVIFATPKAGRSARAGHRQRRPSRLRPSWHHIGTTQIVALDQYSHAPPDIIAQRADPWELPQDLHPFVDPQKDSVGRRWIVCRNVAPDIAQIRFGAEGDKEFSHAGACCL